MTGLNRYSEKDRRKQRRRNHIARDLRTAKYRPRVVPNKKKNYEWEEDGQWDG